MADVIARGMANAIGRIPNTQTWIATEGQTVFTLGNGSYIPNRNLMTVIVDSVPQISGENYTETDSTSFTITAPLPAGTKVYAKWYEVKVPETIGHGVRHERGGSDEIDITKLKGYENISSSVIIQQDTEPTEASEGSFWLDTSDNTFQGTVFEELESQLASKATKLDATTTVTYYVSPSGNDTNDGLTSSTPFQTLQKAFDTVKNVYNVIDGTIKIDLAAGTYEQSASIADVKTKNRIQIIGKKDGNGIPTVIFEGANNAGLPFAMSFSGYMYAMVQDVKVQNYANSVSRSGIVGQLYTNLWTKNVHAYNCGFAGINMDIFCRLYVEGGIIDNCRIGIRGYSNTVVTIGYNNSSQLYTDPNAPIIKNCTETGILIYNMSTGHLDFCTIDGNITGVTIQNSSRLHVWKNLIKNNSLYGVLLGTGSTWYDDANTYTGNAKNYKRGAFSNELNENEYYTPIMKISPTVFLDKVTHTGTLSETYLNTLNTSMVHQVTANTFVTKGQKLKIIVTGTFTGAGTKTVNVKIGTSLISGYTSVSGSTKNFYLEIDYFAVNSGSQKVYSKWFEGNSAYNGLYIDRTFNHGTTNNITVTGTLSDVSGSIVIESFEVREIA